MLGEVLALRALTKIMDANNLADAVSPWRNTDVVQEPEDLARSNRESWERAVVSLKRVEQTGASITVPISYAWSRAL